MQQKPPHADLLMELALKYISGSLNQLIARREQIQEHLPEENQLFLV
jgi:hypothetical protein